MRRLSILLIEDKAHVAARLKAKLEGLGHHVVGLATDGQKAMATAWRLAPDLIIMDFQLPIIDGIETARTILAYKPVPIILLTAYAAADFGRRAREAGVMAYVETPVETRQLVQLINVALARFREFEAIRRETSDLKAALETRIVVEQAKRVLMRRVKLSEAEAFRRMQQQSRMTRASLRDSAAEILRAEEILFRKPNVVCDLQSVLSAIWRGMRTPQRPRSQAPSPATSRSKSAARESSR